MAVPTLQTSFLTKQAGRCHHGFFSRQGGVSEGIYSALNCGPGSGDKPDAIQENRNIVAQHFQPYLTDQSVALLSVAQVHSARVIHVEKTWAVGQRPEADAMVTREPGLILGVLTADCAPVLFQDHKAGVIGAAHAGWRGAVSGIVEETMAAMIEIGAEKSRIKAVVGPCIAQASYEVGADMMSSLLGLHMEAGQFLKQAERDGHAYFDLAGYICWRGRNAGMAIESVAEDTYTQPEKYFSYRRTTHEKGQDYGRQISCIMLGQ